MTRLTYRASCQWEVYHRSDRRWLAYDTAVCPASVAPKFITVRLPKRARIRLTRRLERHGRWVHTLSDDGETRIVVTLIPDAVSQA